jgi:hypothetical protein
VLGNESLSKSPFAWVKGISQRPGAARLSKLANFTSFDNSCLAIAIPKVQAFVI